MIARVDINNLILCRAYQHSSSSETHKYNNTQIIYLEILRIYRDTPLSPLDVRLTVDTPLSYPRLYIRKQSWYFVNHDIPTETLVC